MTTVGHLLTRLHQNAWDAVGDRPSPSRWRCGVGRVAGAAARCLKLLDERGDIWGHLALLESLVDRTISPDPGLARIATSLGAIADVLAISQDELRLSAAAERSRLGTHIQAALHTVTRTPIPGVSLTHRSSLSAVAAATEPASMVPPHALGTTLTHLSPRPDAVTHWARVATQCLSQTASVTGYALQRTAADVALICHAASRRAGEENLSAALARASTCWRSAAAWPAHLRLGGRTPGLTQVSTSLAHTLGADEVPWTTLLRALRAASGVAGAHTRCLEVLAHTHQLWVAASTLPDSPLDRREAHRPPWVREASDGRGSHELAARSASATAALERILTVMGKPPVARWETVDPPRPRREMSPQTGQPVLPGVTW